MSKNRYLAKVLFTIFQTLKRIQAAGKKACLPYLAGWFFEGHSIKDLIKKLESYKDSSIEVRLSNDCSDSHRPISSLGRGYIAKTGKLQIENDAEIKKLIYYCKLTNVTVN